MMVWGAHTFGCTDTSRKLLVSSLHSELRDITDGCKRRVDLNLGDKMSFTYDSNLILILFQWNVGCVLLPWEDYLMVIKKFASSLVLLLSDVHLKCMTMSG